jgi:hypothetical protein
MATRVLQLPVIREGFDRADTGRNALGWATGIRCPRCCRREIVYNGNYFCSGYGDIVGTGDSKQECGWALPHSDEWPEGCEPHHLALQRALIATQYERIEREKRA